MKNLPFFVVEFSLVASPVIAIVLASSTKLYHTSNKFKFIPILFLIHNLFYYFGYSIWDECFDYLTFFLEYLAFCSIAYTTFKYKKEWKMKTLVIISNSIVVLGFVTGTVGFLFVALTTSGEGIDKKLDFSSGESSYEMRRSTSSFPTLSSTKYTFRTYEVSNYFPIEKLIDTTIFFDTKTPLSIGEEGLQIIISRSNMIKSITFKSTNGKSFSKRIN